MSSEAKCPFTGKTSEPKNSDWWPNQLNLQALHQPSPLSDPMGEEFDYHPKPPPTRRERLRNWWEQEKGFLRRYIRKLRADP